MRYRKWYEWLLTVTFLGLLALCLWLNLFSIHGDPSPVNLAINLGMFVIVGFIFIRCELACFFPTGSLTADALQAARYIRKEAQATDKRALWTKLRARRDLFSDQELSDLYADFLRESEREGLSSRAGDLEAYINTSLCDRRMHRALLNQVPGALTGLGILGTFIGLSLGLSQFSTGSTAEITDSIAPLMDGIKVAFHTSIYGMVFSLVFNYVYRRKLSESENALSDLTDAWHTLVMSAPVAEVPVQVQGQEEAVRALVDHFLEELDRSMGASFTRLSATIDDEMRLQRDNAQQIRDILSENQTSAEHYNEWLSEQTRAMRDLHNLVGQLPQSTEHTARALQEALHSSEQYFDRMIKELNTAAERDPARITASYAGFEATLVEATQAMESLTDALKRSSLQTRRKGGLFSR